MMAYPFYLTTITGLLCALAPSVAFAQIGFNERIRPILSDKCFFCHGPDSETRAADLRLDVQGDAIDSGAIVPNSPEDSEVLRRILSDDPEEQMPPPNSKLGRLSAEEAALIRTWIEEGANYEKHWSFEPLPYESLREAAKTNPIDQFVKKELKRQGIAPQPRADLATLARRASFDVTGLPPDRELMLSFLSDRSPEAWSKYLDQLLASPHYGERMGVDWLDVSRYADSFGFQVDREISVWPWRDWVVRSFNDNKPFDAFIVEQLAGDLLPNATQDQHLATAFNRLHQQESEGGSVEEEYRVEYVADRVQTYATAFLGLTFECARCHDHKFDPISQKEYYQLFSIFQNIDEAGLYSFFTHSHPTPTLNLLTPDQKQELEKGGKELEEAMKKASAQRGEVLEKLKEDDREFREWLSKAFSLQKPILSLSMDEVKDKKLLDHLMPERFATLEGENKIAEGKFGMAIAFTGDDPVKTTVGNFERHEPFSVSLWMNTPDVKERAVLFHRSRAWTDAGSRGYELLIEDGKLKWSLIHFWPGDAISIRTKAPIPVDRWNHVAITYDGSSRASGLQIFVDGKRVETEVIRDRLTRNITGGGYDFIDLGERFRDRGFKGGRIDQFEVYSDQLTDLEIRSLAGEFQPPPSHQEGQESLNEEQRSLLIDHYIKRVRPEISSVNKELAEVRKRLYQLEDSATEIMTMRELETPKPAYLLVRGEYNQRGEEVFAGTPAVLPPYTGEEPLNRLGLARWTVSREHPLTSRVIVNRVWQSIFGVGLVRTSEDFGSQGSRPNYPQVLDALAIRFVESGWDMKGVVKEILMSETYQQRSFSNPQQMADDPDNEWLARGPRFRLSAEMIRDNALAASGLLNRKIGGSPAVTYELTESFKPSQPEVGDDIYRRSLYTRWRRTGPPPALITFDAPRRAVCVAKRERTNTPLQALVLLNGLQFTEAAHAMADRIAQEVERDRWIDEVFLRCFSREPDDAERRIATELLNEQLEFFRQDIEGAKGYLEVGQFRSASKLPPEELAALSTLCLTLLNHDACVVKR